MPYGLCRGIYNPYFPNFKCCCTTAIRIIYLYLYTSPPISPETSKH
ncbi:hypothetical protein BMETH_2277_0 [methanotrophic bacterial endosymbiont of Bathymodiolus sp.]|nr:hypothetical protein BMETH_2277_0 [methanotrophic bacterial endosymbiont of Bathymodiolus sp.]